MENLSKSPMVNINDVDVPEKTQPQLEPNVPFQPPTKKKSKLKFIFPLIVLILVFFIGIGGYILAMKYPETSRKAKVGSTNNLPVSLPTSAQNTTTSPTSSSFIPAKGIAFLRNGNVWKVKIDGSNEQQITNVGNISTFKWLSRSNRLIYDSNTRRINGSQYELILYDLSNQQKQVVFSKFWPDSGGISADYSIGYRTSSDEKYLFLTGDCCDQGGVLINLSTLKQENPFSKPVSNILFSPNSDSLVVYINEASNSGKWRLSSSKDFLPQKDLRVKGKPFDWTNNGENILSEGDNTSSDQGGIFQIFYLLQLSDMQTKQLNTEKLEEGNYAYLGQSPDGKQIDYIVDNRYARMVNGQPVPRGPSFVARINLITGQQTTFPNFDKENMLNAPTLGDWLYTPDGKNIVYLYYNATSLLNPSSPTIDRNVRDEIHEINASLDQSTDRVLIKSATSPSWIY